MKTVDAIIDDIIAAEGRSYTNDPADAGGPTKFGITQKTLSEWRGKPVTPRDVELLEEPEARAIYRSRYVNQPHFGLLLDVSASIGTEVVDTGVNMGQTVAAIFLQRALNALNKRASLYPDLLVDGKVGPATAGALRSFIAHRGAEGERVLLEALNHLQGARYIELAESREANEDFVYGWLKNRAAVHG